MYSRSAETEKDDHHSCSPCSFAKGQHEDTWDDSYIADSCPGDEDLGRVGPHISQDDGAVDPLRVNAIAS